MKNKFKAIIVILILVSLIFSLASCASWSRGMKSISSDFSGGMQRKITVYAFDGTIIATYEGKIDISDSSDTEVLFDLNGKRIIITNAIVITEEL